MSLLLGPGGPQLLPALNTVCLPGPQGPWAAPVATCRGQHLEGPRKAGGYEEACPLVRILTCFRALPPSAVVLARLSLGLPCAPCSLRLVTFQPACGVQA